MIVHSLPKRTLIAGHHNADVDCQRKNPELYVYGIQNLCISEILSSSAHTAGKVKNNNYLRAFIKKHILMSLRREDEEVNELYLVEDISAHIFVPFINDVL